MDVFVVHYVNKIYSPDHRILVCWLVDLLGPGSECSTKIACVLWNQLGQLLQWQLPRLLFRRRSYQTTSHLIVPSLKSMLYWGTSWMDWKELKVNFDPRVFIVLPELTLMCNELHSFELFILSLNINYADKMFLPWCIKQFTRIINYRHI